MVTTLNENLQVIPYKSDLGGLDLKCLPQGGVVARRSGPGDGTPGRETGDHPAEYRKHTFGPAHGARTVGRLVAAALPDRWTMHTLRHRFATRAYRGTRNLRAVQTLLGHASIATTERFTAVDDDEIRAAAMAANI